MANGTPRVKKPLPSRKLRRSEQSKVLDSLAGSFYHQIDPRRKQEIMDSRIIQEDGGCVANLSESFINKRFNPNKFMESLGRRDERNEVGE